MAAPVVILGAVGGIGEATARALSAQGVPLVLGGRDPARLAPLADSLGADTVQVDVTDPDALAERLAALDGGDGIAGLVYAVGTIALKPLKAATAEDLLDAFRVNTLGAALAVKALERGLKAAHGAVVLFSTVAVGQGFPNHAAIAAAKGGVEGLTRALAAELAPKVRINCVAPSLTDTEIAKPLTGTAAMADAIAKLHPIPRLGQAEDAAALAAFLVSDRAGWITGQVIGVDGGRSRLRTKG